MRLRIVFKLYKMFRKNWATSVVYYWNLTGAKIHLCAGCLEGKFPVVPAESAPMNILTLVPVHWWLDVDLRTRNMIEDPQSYFFSIR